MPGDLITPNHDCAITLYYQEGDAALGRKSRFYYNCTASAQGWSVQGDGSIHPPSRSRIVRIRLDGYRFQQGGNQLWIAGFQLVATPFFPSDLANWTPRSALDALGVSIVEPADYPADTPVLTFDCTNAGTRLYYRLGIRVGDSTALDWDDPKIYDDGSQ